MNVSTLNEALARAALAPETGIRLLDRRERPTWLGWDEIFGQAQVVAGGLSARGLERGATVGLIYPTGAEFFFAFFGTLLAGGVPVPLYPPVRLGRLAEYQKQTSRMLQAAQTSLALVDRRVRRLVGEALAEASCPGVDLDELPRNGSICESVDDKELALVQFSSGTTMDPKPVALTHWAVMAQISALNAFWPDDASVRHTGASWLPLYHDMGLIGCVFPALERPSELTLIPPEVFVARPAVWLRAISRFGATVSPAPNFAYGLCVEKIRDNELEGVDLSSWRVALNGAEPIAPSVARRFADRFARWGFRREAMTPVYGLSEVALAVTFSAIDSEPASRKVCREALTTKGEVVEDEGGLEIVSVGRPLPGFEIEIRNSHCGNLPDERVGTIWVRGPSMMHGYLHQQEATAAAMTDGWLNTGDLGFLAAGELFVTGREKDMLIVRGRNHSPEEIESVTNTLPGIRTGCCAAVGHMPAAGSAEQVWLFVERHRSRNESQTGDLCGECRRAVLAQTGIFVDRVEVLEPGSLPRTSSGKIRRQETLRRFLAGEMSPPEAVTPWWLLRAAGRSELARRRSLRKT